MTEMTKKSLTVAQPPESLDEVRERKIASIHVGFNGRTGIPTVSVNDLNTFEIEVLDVWGNSHDVWVGPYISHAGYAVGWNGTEKGYRKMLAAWLKSRGYENYEEPWTLEEDFRQKIGGWDDAKAPYPKAF